MWHNDQKLTEFRYVTSQLPLSLLCGVTVAKNKMASAQRRAQKVAWHEKGK
jgi:hypothetical protein